MSGEEQGQPHASKMLREWIDTSDLTDGQRAELTNIADNIDAMPRWEAIFTPPLDEWGSQLAVSHPAHYAGDGRIECMDAMRSMMAPARGVGPIAAMWWGNAFKYLWRWHLKNGVEDLRKAKQCIDYLIAETGGGK